MNGLWFREVCFQARERANARRARLCEQLKSKRVTLIEGDEQVKKEIARLYRLAVYAHRRLHSPISVSHVSHLTGAHS